MTEPSKRAAFVFLLVCAIGVFCELAGGTEWGTFDCGMATALTLTLAVALSVMAFIACGGLE